MCRELFPTTNADCRRRRAYDPLHNKGPPTLNERTTDYALPLKRQENCALKGDEIPRAATARHSALTALLATFLANIDLLSPLLSIVARWIACPPGHKSMQGGGRFCTFFQKYEYPYLPQRLAIVATIFQMASIRLSVVQTSGNLALLNGDYHQAPLLILHTLDSTKTE